MSVSVTDTDKVQQYSIIKTHQGQEPYQNASHFFTVFQINYGLFWLGRDNKEVVNTSENYPFHLFFKKLGLMIFLIGLLAVNTFEVGGWGGGVGVLNEDLTCTAQKGTGGVKCGSYLYNRGTGSAK